MAARRGFRLGGLLLLVIGLAGGWWLLDSGPVRRSLADARAEAENGRLRELAAAQERQRAAANKRRLSARISASQPRLSVGVNAGETYRFAVGELGAKWWGWETTSCVDILVNGRHRAESCPNESLNVDDLLASRERASWIDISPRESSVVLDLWAEYRDFGVNLTREVPAKDVFVRPGEFITVTASTTVAGGFSWGRQVIASEVAVTTRDHCLVVVWSDPRGSQKVCGSGAFNSAEVLGKGKFEKLYVRADKSLATVHLEATW